MSTRASRIATSPDVQRVGQALARPGMDTRNWVQLAIVKEIDVDPDHGVFATVTTMPDGLEQQARLGVIYAGDGFGVYAPLRVDDEVLCAVPEGDPDHGLVIVARLWSAADKPPTDVGSQDAPSEDLIVVVDRDKSLRVRLVGNGNAVIAVDAGKVYLGGPDTGDGAATEPAVLGDTLNEYLKSARAGLKVWLDTHTHPAPGGATSAPTTRSPDVPDVRAQKVVVK
jgi:hypothetical protein